MLARKKYDDYWREVADKGEDKIPLLKRQVAKRPAEGEKIRLDKKGILQQKAG